MLRIIVLASLLPIVSRPPSAAGDPTTPQDVLAILAECPVNSHSIDLPRIVDLTTQALALNLSDDDHVRILSMRAIALQRQRVFDKAIADYEQILRLRPEGIDNQLAYGFCLLRAERIDDAKAIFQAILARNEKAARPNVGLAYCYYASGDADKALGRYQKAQSADPDDWLVVMCSAQLGITGIQPGLADRIEKLTRIIDMWGANSSWLPFTLAEAYKTRGQLETNRSAYGKALTDFLTARSLEPGGRLECICRYEAVFCYLRLGNYKTAGLVAEETKRILERHQRDSYNAALLRQIQLVSIALSGQSAEAADRAMAFLKKGPPQPTDFQLAVQYAVLAGRFSDALSLCEIVEKGFVARFEGIDACRAYLLSACPVDSVRDGRLALKLTEDYEKDYGRNARLLMIRAMALAEAGRFAEAVKIGSRAIEVLPSECPVRAEYVRRVRLFEDGKPFRFDQKRPDFDLIDRP